MTGKLQKGWQDYRTPIHWKMLFIFLDEIAPKELVWIAQHSETGELLGVAGLKPHEDAGIMELGYWLGRQFWGRGFGTEAANVVLDYAFGAPSTSEVTAGCFTDNLRSERLLKKLGFHIAKESLRFCLAEGRELPHYDMLLTRKVRESGNYVLKSSKQ
jgi:RimJ/RimL family protein N-acetyltransferase